MSKDSNTDTIHFPFINWCGNVGPAAVTSEVFQGGEVAEFVLRVAEKASSTGRVILVALHP